MNTPQKHHPLFVAKPPLKSANCPSTPAPSLSVFHVLPPPKSPIFWFLSERQKYQSFSSLIPSYLLKVTKFLVKISKYEFLVINRGKYFCL